MRQTDRQTAWVSYKGKKKRRKKSRELGDRQTDTPSMGKKGGDGRRMGEQRVCLGLGQWNERRERERQNKPPRHIIKKSLPCTRGFDLAYPTKKTCLYVSWNDWTFFQGLSMLFTEENLLYFKQRHCTSFCLENMIGHDWPLRIASFCVSFHSLTARLSLSLYIYVGVYRYLSIQPILGKKGRKEM